MSDAKTPTEADVTSRIEELRETCSTPGWGYGHEPPIDPLCLGRALPLARELVSVGTPWPYVYPSPRGGVTFEWTDGDCEISLEVYGALAGFDATNVKTGWSVDFETALSQTTDKGIANSVASAWPTPLPLAPPELERKVAAAVAKARCGYQRVLPKQARKDT